MANPPIPTLLPGPPGRMLRDAMRHVKSLPMDQDQRADAFESLARQIDAHTFGAWSAKRGIGTDDSVIFLGRQGEGFVVTTDGRIFRGSIGQGNRSDDRWATRGSRPTYFDGLRRGS
jgi:hypothetical protein